MRDHSGDCIIKQAHKHGHDATVEALLELRLHVIRDLADAVAHGVPDLGVGVLSELKDGHDDGLDILAPVKVLTYL